jgi:ATP-binding cassette subfamily F protein 3
MEATKLLRGFLFDRDILERKVGALSGGERNRLQIARAVWLGANFLILDEPTNHLDIPGREAVEEGLADFEGSILVVSHDRWFLEKSADRLVLLEDRGFLPYEGSFSEYWRDVGKPAAEAARQAGARASGELAGRGAALAQAGKVASRQGRRGEIEASGGSGAAGLRALELERRIGEAEARRASLEKEAEAAIASRDFARSGRLSAEAGDLGRLIDKLYDEWGKLG